MERVCDLLVVECNQWFAICCIYIQLGSTLFLFFFLSDRFILFFRPNKGLILPLDLKFRISAENKAPNYKFNIWNELQIFYLLRL